MNRTMWTLIALAAGLALTPAALAQDIAPKGESEASTDGEPEPVEEAPEAATEPGGPKTLSGMSILGNEEAPKSLVIIPWKSSEIGSDLGLDDSLDERPEPVDREVFLRELAFYEIRAGE